MFSQNCMYNYYPEKNLEQKNVCFLVIIALSTEDLCAVFSKLCFFFPWKSWKEAIEQKGQMPFKFKIKGIQFIISEISITLKVVHQFWSKLNWADFQNIPFQVKFRSPNIPFPKCRMLIIINYKFWIYSKFNPSALCFP